jgi:hypothetical protein
MSFHPPEDLKLSNYRIDEQGLIKIAHLLHTLRDRYPKWTLRVKYISDRGRSVSLRMFDEDGEAVYVYHRFDVYEETVSNCMMIKSKESLEIHLQMLDDWYNGIKPKPHWSVC